MKKFDNFLNTIDNPENRKKIEGVLTWIKTTYPLLVTELKWNQPMFVDHGTFIIGFSIAKQHFSVAPEQKTMKLYSIDIEKSGYKQTDNLFKINWNQEVNYELLKNIIDFNIEDKSEYNKFWR